MTERDDLLSDAEFDMLLDAARRDRDVPGDLRARVLDDAAAVSAARSAALPPRQTSARKRRIPGWIEGLIWPAGLAAATFAGLAVGQSPILYEQLTTAGVLNGSLGYDLTYHLPALVGLIGGY